MKVTRHKDGTVSLRLVRSSLAGEGGSIEDIVFALGQAALGFEMMTQKYPGEAADYQRLADHHRQLAAAIEAGSAWR